MHVGDLACVTESSVVSSLFCASGGAKLAFLLRLLRCCQFQAYPFSLHTSVFEHILPTAFAYPVLFISHRSDLRGGSRILQANMRSHAAIVVFTAIGCCLLLSNVYGFELTQDITDPSACDTQDCDGSISVAPVEGDESAYSIEWDDDEMLNDVWQRKGLCEGSYHYTVSKTGESEPKEGTVNLAVVQVTVTQNGDKVKASIDGGEEPFTYRWVVDSEESLNSSADDEIDVPASACLTECLIVLDVMDSSPVSYTHLTLPTNREV